jgi:hypothetical protein
LTNYPPLCILRLQVGPNQSTPPGAASNFQAHMLAAQNLEQKLADGPAAQR